MREPSGTSNPAASPQAAGAREPSGTSNLVVSPPAQAPRRSSRQTRPVERYSPVLHLDIEDDDVLDLDLLEGPTGDWGDGQEEELL